MPLESMVPVDFISELMRRFKQFFVYKKNGCMIDFLNNFCNLYSIAGCLYL